MSIDGMRSAWGPLFEQTQAFYDFARPALSRNEPLEDAQFEEIEGLLDEMLNASEQIRKDADQVLARDLGDMYKATSTLLLAAAAIDAMLASDLATLDPEFGASRREEIFERGESLEELVGEREQTLRQVNRLFLGEEDSTPAGGALADDRRQLIEVAHQVTTELVDLAKGPSPELLRGLAVAATGGAADVLAAAQHVDVLADLTGTAAGVVNRAPRFLREHAAKMLALQADQQVIGDVVECVRQKVDIEARLFWIADYENANTRTQQLIAEAATIDTGDAEELEAELRGLLPDYEQQMGWIGTSAKWLRRGASPLTHLVAPFVGHAAICGVFLLGIGYVIYSLTDRIDARDLGFADHIDGVLRLVGNRTGGEFSERKR